MGAVKKIINSASLQNHFTSAIILAAGIGSRFGNENGTKQNVPVCGIPAVVRTLLAFENCSVINEIVIVGRREELETLRSYVEERKLTKVSAVVEGGATRDRSSYNGFCAVSDKCEYVAIHDGARCLVTPEIIEKTVIAAYGYSCAAAAEKVVDTVKRCDSKDFINETVDREGLWLIKTPQVFKSSVYLVSSEKARQDGVSVTDDCMMAERCGFKIKLIDCGKENIKLTTRDDMSLAEYIVIKREKEEGAQ